MPGLIGVLCLTATGRATAQIGAISELHAFAPGTDDYGNPAPVTPSNLILGHDGNLYGTIRGPGSTVTNFAAIFQLTTSGAFKIVRDSFATGFADPASLIMGRNGNLYISIGMGKTMFGSYQSWFYGVTTGGHLTQGDSFRLQNPPQNLVQGGDGNFYCTSDSGRIYKVPLGQIGLDGTYSVFATVGYGKASLLLGKDGNFYGIAQIPFNGGGTGFKITPSGTKSTFTIFDPSAVPECLIQARDGSFYGTTSLAGTYGNGGTFFKVVSGVVTTLASFDTNTAANAIIQGADGDFYGTTANDGIYGQGTIFRVTASGVFSTLASFTGTNGAFPRSRLVQANDGSLYGTTSEGGSLAGGNVFRFVLPEPPVPPSLTITTPVSGQRVSNNVVTLAGTTSGNISVTNVFYSLNGSDWDATASANNWTNWTAQVFLTPGLNMIRAYALDAIGNTSTIHNVTNIYVVSDIPIVQTNGSGSITPNLNSKLLELGTAHVITAAPFPGNIFTGWTGSITTNNPKLTFLMQSNLVLTANFIANPFIPVRGSYNGLFAESNGVQQYSSGSFSATVTTPTSTSVGKFSAKTRTGLSINSFSGAFDLSGHAHSVLKSYGTNRLSLDLQLDFGSGADRLSGTLSSANWTSDIEAKRAIFGPTNPCPHAGKYTLVFPGNNRAPDIGSDPAAPQGDSFGTLTVSRNGVITFLGSLADNTPITLSVPISNNGEWPLYVSLNSGNGSIESWIAVTNAPDLELTGLTSWIKPANALSKYYPLGFTNETVALGSIYYPATTNRAIALTNGTVLFGGNGFISPFTNDVFLSATNRVFNLSSNKLTVIIANVNGTFGGLATPPGSTANRAYKGVLLQNQNLGRGYSLGTNQSGPVFLSPVD